MERIEERVRYGSGHILSRRVRGDSHSSDERASVCHTTDPTNVSTDIVPATIDSLLYLVCFLFLIYFPLSPSLSSTPHHQLSVKFLTPLLCVFSDPNHVLLDHRPRIQMANVRAVPRVVCCAIPIRRADRKVLVITSRNRPQSWVCESTVPSI